MSQQLADDMDLLLMALLYGAARIEPSTKEFCINGIRYSVSDFNWTAVADAAGRDAIMNAIRTAKAKGATNA